MTNTVEIKELKKLRSIIKQKCMDCSGNKASEVENCPLVPVYRKRTLVMGCPLWPYRRGSGPTDKDERKLKRTRSAYEKSRRDTG